MCDTGKWKQFGYALIITSALISGGGVIGWSVEVSKIYDDVEKTFDFTLQDEELLIAVVGLAALFISFFAGWLVEFFGPRTLVLLILLPQSLAWIVMATSDSFYWILTGRIVTGFFVQLSMISIQPFLGEISEPNIRGSLLCLPEIVFSLGMLMMYVFARFMSWQNGTLITGVLVFPVMALYLYVPESPYWYIRKGKLKDAIRSLSRLRSPDHDVDSELKNIKEVVVDSRNAEGTFKEQICSMIEPAHYRPTILLSFVFFLREMSGALAIFTYAPFFFTNAGIPIDPFSATILIGFSRLIFNIIAAVVIDYVGRRNLFISSSLICFSMMVVTGVFLHFPYPYLSWIPLVAVIIFVASFGLGLGPLPWVLIGEILPTPVRSLASSICSVIFCIVFYLEAYYFPELIIAYGLEKLVFGFAFFNIVLAITVWLFLPETQNRTLEDLQTAFVGAAVRPFKKQREGYLQPYGTNYSSLKQRVP